MQSKNKRHLVMILFAILCCLNQTTWSREHSPAQTREYTIKAAFLYNFLKTIEWPSSVFENDDEPFTIGIVGQDNFKNAFKPIQDKHVHNRKIRIIRIQHLRNVKAIDTSYIQALRSCHLVFISRSETKFCKDILRQTQGHCILTVGEIVDFLSLGGMINFIPHALKPEFEINLKCTNHEHLKLSSKLIRIAKRVIKDGETQ